MSTSSARGFYVLASVLAGAALGLVAYRFGMLPVGWKAKAGLVFPGLAAGLIIAARAVVKDRGPRPAIPLLVIGALVGGAAAFGISFLAVPPLSHARLTVHAMPGFTIELPAGEAPAQKFFEYDLGKLMLTNVGGQGGVIAVTWEGGEASRADLEIAGKALGPALGASGPTALVTMDGPRGTAVDTLVLQSDKGPMRMSLLPCGTRRVMVMTMVGATTEVLHARVLATFQCKPDPKRETLRIGVVPLIVDLPGWFATERDANQVVLTNGRGLLMLKTIASSTKPVEDTVLPVLNAVGWKLAITGREGDRTLVSGTFAGELVHGWVRSIPCMTQSVIVIGIATDLAGAREIATQLDRARCARPGETPTAWPDPPAELAEELAAEPTGSATPAPATPAP